MSSRMSTINECTLAVEGDVQCSKFRLNWIFAILSFPSHPDPFIAYLSPPTPVFLLRPILALQVNLVEAERFMLATFLPTDTDGGKSQSSSFDSIKEGRGRFKRPVKGNRAKVWGVFH